MTAQISPASSWWRARNQRALTGKAPRLAVRRSILMRQAPNGSWTVAVCEWRFGKWKKPEWLCQSVPFDQAHGVTLQAWRQYRLPVCWSYSSDTRLRPFLFGRNEPAESAA